MPTLRIERSVTIPDTAAPYKRPSATVTRSPPMGSGPRKPSKPNSQRPPWPPCTLITTAPAPRSTSTGRVGHLADDQTSSGSPRRPPPPSRRPSPLLQTPTQPRRTDPPPLPPRPPPHLSCHLMVFGPRFRARFWILGAFMNLWCRPRHHESRCHQETLSGMGERRALHVHRRPLGRGGGLSVGVIQEIAPNPAKALEVGIDLGQ